MLLRQSCPLIRAYTLENQLPAMAMALQKLPLEQQVRINRKASEVQAEGSDSVPEKEDEQAERVRPSMKTIELEQGRMFVLLKGKCFIKKKFNAHETVGDKLWQTNPNYAYKKSLLKGKDEGLFDDVTTSSSDEAE